MGAEWMHESGLWDSGAGGMESGFMLRITRLAESPSSVMLLLEGHIRSQWIDQLESEVYACQRARQQVVLDFGGVNFVSPAGIELLRRLRGTGVQFLRCPAIVTDLLK
jgi:hypothetical protein